MKKVKLLPYQSDKTKEIEIIEIGKSQTIDSSVETPYRTDFYQIIWFKKGKMTGSVDFEKIEFEPNTITFLNKNKIQSYKDFENVEAVIFLFTDNFYNNSLASSRHIDRSLVFSDLIENSTIKATNPNFSIIENILFDEYFQMDDIISKEILRNQLHSFVLLAEREIQKNHQNKLKNADLNLYLEFKNLINKNYSNHKSVEFYCSQLNITEKSLNRAIKNVSGITAKSIIHHKVLIEAKWLLGNNDSSIKVVSNELGFSEPTNFVKYFKKYMGVSPSEYIKTEQA